MNKYRPRVVDVQLGDLMKQMSAISLEGPRSIGKTTTARQWAETYFPLDDPETLEIVTSDPSLLTNSPEPIVIDEWQLFPASWDYVRRAVDKNRRPGRFILTGSVTPPERPTHSGAGRIVSLRMRPLSLSERWSQSQIWPSTVSLSDLISGNRPPVKGETPARLDDYVNQIVGGGFPGMQDLTSKGLNAALRGYLQQIVNVDVAEAGLRLRKPEGLQRWLTAYAAASSTTASYEKIRGAATGGHGNKPSRTTTLPYIEALERLWLLDPIPAWRPINNPLPRLKSGPKHNLVDPALATSLLGLTSPALLKINSKVPPIPRDGTLLAALFESLIALNLQVYAQACESRVFHLRQWSDKREVDFIVQRPDHRVVAIEVKLAQTVQTKHVRHLHWLQEKLGDDLLDAVVINTGTTAYRRADQIAVIPAALLGP